MYYQAWKFLYSIDEAINKIETMLENGIVQISRFSMDGFLPQSQLGEFAIERGILNEDGCYVFIHGT